MSKRDSLFCVECQPFIEAEYKIRGEKYERFITFASEALQAVSTPQNDVPMELVVEKEKEVLLHTKTDKPHAYQNPTRDRPKANVGGRPKKNIPVKLIRKLSKEGMSIAEVVRELKTRGQSLSAMTVQRVLSGERA
jgi:hypothetical protein